MKIWVYLNGIQQGPYSLEELTQLNLAPSTPVWYEGLPQWMPACEAPVTASIFGAELSEQQPDAKPESAQETESHQEASYHQPAVAQTVAARGDQPAAPPTFIGWSVFVLICCFPIGGVLGIIFSIISGNAYRAGDYVKAARMSESAEWCIIISIVLGLVMMPLALAIF